MHILGYISRLLVQKYQWHSSAFHVIFIFLENPRVFFLFLVYNLIFNNFYCFTYWKSKIWNISLRLLSTERNEILLLLAVHQTECSIWADCLNEFACSVSNDTKSMGFNVVVAISFSTLETWINNTNKKSQKNSLKRELYHRNEWKNNKLDHVFDTV